MAPGHGPRTDSGRLRGFGLRQVEWPSIFLCGGIYGGFLLVTFFHARMPNWVFAAGGAALLALQSSMQHEFIHGHPTPWRRFNRLLGFIPLSLWLPFESYRRSHLIHHCDERLTDPFDDPETHYWSAAAFGRLGPIGRGFIALQGTLLGRLMFGPAWTIGRYLKREAGALLRGDRLALRIWAWHGLGVAMVLVWVVAVCRIDPVVYCFGLVYPATALLLLRSFAEHRAEPGIAERTAIVENAPILGFLFLYNNLHAAHHEAPLVPWYRLPVWYRANRARLVAQNRGLVYDGYGSIFRRFLIAPHHVAVHPFGAERDTPAAVAPAPFPRLPRPSRSDGAATGRLAKSRRMGDDHGVLQDKTKAA